MTEPDGKRHPFVLLFLARMREFVREPEVLFWVFGFPVALAIGLGIAFREERPEVAAVAVLAGDAAADVVAKLPADAGFDVQVLDADAAALALRLGRVALVVEPGDPVTYRYDPVRPDGKPTRERVDAALQRAAGRADPLAVRDVTTTEPGARYIDFLIPGLLGMNIMSGGMWGVGYALVDMRVRRLLKRLAATPMRRSHFLAALMASRMVVVFLEMLLLLVFGWLVFGVDVRGSVAAIAATSVVGAFTFSGIGLLVASRCQKTETVSGLMNLVMLPMFVLSGVFFSSDRFPDVTQPFIQALPLTALNDALRAVILEGTTLWAEWDHALILLAWGIGSFAVALRVFRWT
jgi:ABC-type multidrug transport system permease subunit